MFFSLNENEYKRTIYITEEQMNYILTEAMDIDDIYTKYYNTIPREEFNQIIQADPTFNPQKPNKIGKYSKWLLKLYGTNNLKLEDLYKATQYLTIFEKYKRRIQPNDINMFRNLPSLYNAVEPYLEGDAPTSHQDEIRRQKEEGADIIYNSSDWEIIIPKTWEASKLYGANTQWCTASRESDNWFNSYTKGGNNLYINIDKRNNRKYQFYFKQGQEQFMDETDEEIEKPIAETINMPKEVLDFYSSIGVNSLIFTFPTEGSKLILNSDDNDYDGDIWLINNYNDEYALFCDYTQVTPFIYSNNVQEANSYFIILQNADGLFNLLLKYGNKFKQVGKDCQEIISLNDIDKDDDYYFELQFDEFPYVVMFNTDNSMLFVNCMDDFDNQRTISVGDALGIRRIGLYTFDVIKNDYSHVLIGINQDYELEPIISNIFNPNKKYYFKADDNDMIYPILTNGQQTSLQIQ